MHFVKLAARLQLPGDLCCTPQHHVSGLGQAASLSQKQQYQTSSHMHEGFARGLQQLVQLCLTPQALTARLATTLAGPDTMQMFLSVQVEVIKAASLTWRQWHGNLYHGLGEAVYEIFNCACKYLEHCGGEDGSELSPIFIETTGDDTQWADALPAAESVLRCLFPGPDYSLGDKAIHDRVRLCLHQLRDSIYTSGPACTVEHCIKHNTIDLIALWYDMHTVNADAFPNRLNNLYTR